MMTLSAELPVPLIAPAPLISVRFSRLIPSV